MAGYEEYFAGDIETSDNSRSAKDMAFSMFLARRGLEPGEIAVLLREADYNQGKKLREKYLERTISKAMEKAPSQAAFLPPTPEEYSPLRTAPTLWQYSDLKDTEFPDPELVSTGIHALDKYCHGGLALKEVSLFIAAQETGKSTLASFIGAQSVKQGYNTLHIFYEDSLASVKSRYDSALQGEEWGGEAYLLDATEFPATLRDIETQIESIKPGMVIVDYFARIPPLRGAKEGRFEIKDTLMYLCNLARKYNTHILITDHITIEDEGRDPNYKMAFHRVSESKMYKLMVTSVVVGLMKDLVDMNKVWITGLKHKRKASRMFTSMTVNWDTGDFS